MLYNVSTNQMRSYKTMSETKKKTTDKKAPSVGLHQTDMGGKDKAKTKKKNTDKRKNIKKPKRP